MGNRFAGHTPGPWKAKHNGRYDNSQNTWTVEDEEASCSEAAPITTADGAVIGFAVSSDDSYYPSDPENDANAELMAAAPALLALAQKFLANIDEWDGEPGPGMRWHEEYTEAKSILSGARAP